MGSPLPLQGTTNPFSALYQTKQFKTTSMSLPGSNTTHGGLTGPRNVFDSLESPPAAATAAVIASDPLEERANFWNLTPQTITVNGSPSTGSFVLGYRGFPTSSLNAVTGTAAQVEDALEALSSVGGENLTVAGPTGGPWVVSITLTSPLSMIDLVSSTFTGGTSPSITIASPAQQPGISPF